MESLVWGLFDLSLGGNPGGWLDRLFQFPYRDDVFAAMRRLGVSILEPRKGAAAAGFGATLAAVLTWRWWKFAFFALFTRILPPKVLNQQTRARIFEHIERNPGVRALHLAKALDLATGQAAHHLYVLERQGLIVRTRGALARRYFPKGRLPAHEMHHLIVRQTPALAGLHTAIQERPGSTVTELAAALRLSAARVSRLAQRLVETDLIERVPEGRSVRLYPKSR